MWSRITTWHYLRPPSYKLHLYQLTSHCQLLLHPCILGILASLLNWPGCRVGCNRYGCIYTLRSLQPNQQLSDQTQQDDITGCEMVLGVQYTKNEVHVPRNVIGVELSYRGWRTHFACEESRGYNPEVVLTYLQLLENEPRFATLACSGGFSTSNTFQGLPS